MKEILLKESTTKTHKGYFTIVKDYKDFHTQPNYYTLYQHM